LQFAQLFEKQKLATR